MNIQDIMAQEQKVAGTGQSSMRVYAGQNDESLLAQLTGSASVKGSMEMPITPAGYSDGEGSDTYSFPEALETAAENAEISGKVSQNLAILTGEDYSQLEEQDGALEQYQESSLERAVERIHAEREWKAGCMEENAALREELQEGLEQVQATGFLSEKSEAQIRNALEQAGLPVSQEMVVEVVSALQMSQSAAELSDSARRFLLTQDLPVTIENLYHAQYSGMEAVSEENVPQDIWDKYGPQIEQILTDLGDTGLEQMTQAKWLFANELPVNAGTLSNVQELENLAANSTLDHRLNLILEQMAAGGRAVDTDLIQGSRAHREYQEQAEFVQRVAGIGEQDIRQALQNIREMTDQDADGSSNGQDTASQYASWQNAAQKDTVESDTASEALTIAKLFEAGTSSAANVVQDAEIDIQTVTARRQLEEIRLMMTTESAVQLRRQGFSIETEPLEDVVEQLKSLENSYYMQQAGERGITLSDSDLSQMRDVMRQTADIALSPAAMLGSSLRQHQLMTVRELHGIAMQTTAQYQQYGQDYEAVGTQVRQDLGDSIRKAFEGIPQMLREMGLEDTAANERAVRILGYNQMEITPEQIEEMKQWDAQVQRLIKEMKPSAVLDLIRDGEDPFHIPIEQLNEQMADRNRQKEPSEEERYSRYLWQLERQDGISEPEREKYIGIYRLLHQIEKSDGAAIGAVLQAGQQMDLQHLRTAVRTLRTHGVDERVSDSDGVRESSVQYYQNMTEEMLRSITPAKVQEITGGDPGRLFDQSLERTSEELEQASGDPTLLQQYYEEQAETLRETVRQADQARTFLEGYEIPDTLENIRAAEYMLEEAGSPMREIIERRRVLAEDEQEELDDLLEEWPESIGDSETLQQKCEQAERFMQEILTKSRETADITSEELTHLKLLGQSLRLQQTLNRRQNYEIPIQTGDTVTMLNLTILHGEQDGGKVQIRMDETQLGRISGEMQLQGEQIKGLILCDDRAGFDALKERGEALTSRLETAGYHVRNISYGMDYRTRSGMTEFPGDQQTDTAALYQVAKILVRHISDTAKQATG